MSQELIVLAGGAIVWLALSVFFWRLTRYATVSRSLLRTMVLFVALGLPLALIVWSLLLPMEETAMRPAPGLPLPDAQTMPAMPDLPRKADDASPARPVPVPDSAVGMAADEGTMPKTADDEKPEAAEKKLAEPQQPDAAAKAEAEIAAQREAMAKEEARRAEAAAKADAEPPVVAEAAPDEEKSSESSGDTRTRGLRPSASRDFGTLGAGGSAGSAATEPATPTAPPVVVAEPQPAPAPAPPVPAAPAAPASSDKYDSVPVYYGTDRDRIDSGGRVAYGTGRARRLELGRAFVTIPKAHHAPGQIERPFEVVVLGYTVYAEAEDPTKHFTLYSVNPLDRDAFLAEVRLRLAASKAFKDHALVFIHGYNTSFDAALYRSAQMTYDLGFDGAPFVYSWPSQGGVASYETDQNSSEQAQPYLQQFLDLVLKETGAKNLTIIAHSMGNLPLLRILNGMQIAAAASQNGVRINQIILAAPDVDRDVFQTLTGNLGVLSDNVTLYASANDRAMKASRTYAGGVPRAGDVPEGGPVVAKGIDTVDISNISSDILALNHSAFAERSQLLQDIGKIVQSGLRPPPKRDPGLEELPTEVGAYWRFPAGQP